jgi:ATP-dependent Clp protease ATP-binding subunit ClpB
MEREKLRAQWEKERAVVQEIRSLQEKQEEALLGEQQAERKGDLAKVAEIRYGTRPALEKQIAEARAKLGALHQGGVRLVKEEVDEEDIAEVVGKWTGIPVSRLLEGEVEKLIHMEARLRARVVGQDEAVRAVSEAVRRARAGLQDPNRPLGSFLFLGPTGVGKTELARALAWFLFDDERAMVRIDMSEYMEKHSTSRMIGAPPGYVGYDEGGALTEAVRRRPYSVVLFDEVEKAHPDVLNVLLQLLDDGRLTDGQGRTVDFRNAIVIMTSNLGSEAIREMADKERAIMVAEVNRQLRAHFRPELLNRIDDIVIFHALDLERIQQIVRIQLEKLTAMVAQRGLTLELTDRAVLALAKEGFDPAFGARPLKRAIQKEVQNPLAMKLLEGTFPAGSTVTVDHQDGKFTFEAGSKVKPPKGKPRTEGAPAN